MIIIAFISILFKYSLNITSRPHSFKGFQPLLSSSDLIKNLPTCWKIAHTSHLGMRGSLDPF
ncbi:hypothetical protein IC582_006435 [Cucumis melo]